MKNTGILAFVATALALAGCRTTEDVIRDYNLDFANGLYERGATETDGLAASGGGDALLWHQLAGSAMRLSGRERDAIAHFDAAERCYADNDTRSVFSRGASSTTAMMVNDTMFAYDGDGVDRVFTCLYKAIDFLSFGNVELARVELNRASQYQRNWLYDMRKEIEDARKRFDADANNYIKSQKAFSSSRSERQNQIDTALSDAQFRDKFIANCGFDPATSGDIEAIASSKAFMNPYALHLTGVFRWLANDSDKNDLRDLAALAPYCTTARRDASECRKGIRPENQVWVFIEDGLCPYRSEWRCDLPLYFIPGANRYLPYVAMAFPTLNYRSNAAENWRVGGNATERLADIDGLVKTEYDIYMRSALTREISRTLIRAGMEIALGILAESHRNQNDYWAYKAAQIGVALWAASCTKADVRSWTALPKRVLVARVDRPASGIISVKAGVETLELPVPPGNTLLFIRKPGPSAPAIVKSFTFR